MGGFFKNILFIKDAKQFSPLNNDFHDRKRNSFPSSSLRDNNNKQIGNKRPYDQSSRNNDRNIPRRQSPLSPASKKRRTNSTIIEDEYHEYEHSSI